MTEWSSRPQVLSFQTKKKISLWSAEWIYWNIFNLNETYQKDLKWKVKKRFQNSMQYNFFVSIFTFRYQRLECHKLSSLTLWSISTVQAWTLWSSTEKKNVFIQGFKECVVHILFLCMKFAQYVQSILSIPLNRKYMGTNSPQIHNSKIFG